VGALDHLSCWLNPVCQLWQAVKLLWLVLDTTSFQERNCVDCVMSFIRHWRGEICAHAATHAWECAFRMVPGGVCGFDSGVTHICVCSSFLVMMSMAKKKKALKCKHCESIQQTEVSLSPTRNPQHEPTECNSCAALLLASTTAATRCFVSLLNLGLG